MAYEAPATVVTDEKYTAAAHNIIVNDVLFFRTPPIARVQLGGSQTIITATWTIVTSWSEAIDTDGMWTSANNYIEIITAGIYQVSFSAAFANNASGGRIGVMSLNNATANGAGGILQSSIVPTSITDAQVGGSLTRAFVAGDKLRVQVYQNSGGDLGLVSTAENYMAAVFVGNTA